MSFSSGDWNAKVGSQEIPGVTGKFGIGVQNEDKRLTEFCQVNALVIANTLFQQYKRRLYIWTSPDDQYWNQTDYILCRQRWSSSMQSKKTKQKTRQGADCGTDHELLIAKFRIKLKKRGKTTRPFSSVQFSRSVMSDSLWPHELKHTRLPCPSPTPGVYSNSCPSSLWCHPTISSSVVPFSSCPQSLPALGSFLIVNSSHEVAKVLDHSGMT